MSGSNSGDFASALLDAVRQNPVSAALVGVGVLWMFTGGSKLTAAAALLGPVARSATSGAASGVQHSVEAIASAGDGIRSLGAHVSNSVQDAIGGAASAVGDAASAVGDAASAVGDAASRSYESVKGAPSQPTSQLVPADTPPIGSSLAFGGALQENLRQTLDRQPLLLGALGIAIGAGMAAAFPTTQTEQDVAGDAADRVIAQVKDVASSTADKASAAASRTLEAVKQEASNQGLTVQAAKDGVASVGEKVKSVAKAAQTKTSSNA